MALTTIEGSAQRPILSDALKARFEGTVPELKIVDGNVGPNGKATYLMVPPLLEASFAQGVPTVDSPEFGSHLRPEQRDKLRRSVHRMERIPSRFLFLNLSWAKEGLIRATETRAALADSAVIIGEKRAEAKQAGKGQTSLRREVSTLVPWVQSEALLHDPVAQYDKFLTKETPGDQQYVEGIMIDAVSTLTRDINVDPPSLFMDGLSFISGWLTAPIDWPRAAKSWRERQFDMNATKMFVTTALIDLAPHMTPGISSSHARWGLNTHKLLEQAIQIDSMYNHLVLGQENERVPRSRLYAQIAQNMLNNLGARDPLTYYDLKAPLLKHRSPLENIHDTSINKANQMRRELGLQRQKNQFLTADEIRRYEEHAKTPEQYYRLLTYTMGAKLESALDVVNNASPRPIRYK